MTDNVVAFVPRPKAPEEAPPPELQFVELKLDTSDCSLVMSVCDEAGDVFVLRYRLASVPDGFDLDRLVRAWDQWRGCTGRAS